MLVKDTKTTAFYVEDLGVLTSSLRDPSVIASDPGYNTDFSPATTGPLNQPASIARTSANLAAFFSARSGDTFTWSILGADSSGGSLDAGSQSIALTSTLNHLTVSPNWQSGDVANSAASIVSFFSDDLNTHTFSNGVSTASGWGDGAQGGQAPVTYNTAAQANGAAVGTAQTLYLISTYGAGSSANVYAASATLSLGLDGKLTINGGVTPTVPLPAAFWLFGSGLLGLVGVGRRKATNV